MGIDVNYIAKLARLTLTLAEKKKFQWQLDDIIKFVSQLQEVDIKGVEPTAQVTGLTDVVREDEVKACDVDERKNALGQIPEKAGDLLKVQGVFE
jgi:aspartyl-tRNA(Asn)/glutamyl-tRNA(Gln) amidotransferase subunit C